MRLRPLLPADAPAVHALATAAFVDLARRTNAPESPTFGGEEAALLRIRHLATTDPGGAWLAEEDGIPAGAALALVREGVWGLSLLVVRPGAQSRGIGRALLDRALRHGSGVRGRIVLASDDPRALRAYVRAGLTFHPSARAAGAPRGVSVPAGVRPFEPGDRAWADAVGRQVRGAPHGGDLDALAAGGAELLAVPERGYAAHRDGDLKLLAAIDEDAARMLLRAAIARAHDGAPATVRWLTGAQRWAVDAAVEAGLELRLEGAVFLGGDTGPFTPYLPSGAYL